MRRTQIFSATLLVAIMIPVIRQAHAATRSIEGVISDSMCGRTHMKTSKSNAECVAKCLKGGAGYALVVGNKVYLLAGNPQTITPFAAKHVKVSGSVKGNTVTVTSVAESNAATMHDGSSMPM